MMSESEQSLEIQDDKHLIDDDECDDDSDLDDIGKYFW